MQSNPTGMANTGEVTGQSKYSVSDRQSTSSYITDKWCKIAT